MIAAASQTKPFGFQGVRPRKRAWRERPSRFRPVLTSPGQAKQSSPCGHAHEIHRSWKEELKPRHARLRQSAVSRGAQTTAHKSIKGSKLLILGLATTPNIDASANPPASS